MNKLLTKTKEFDAKFQDQKGKDKEKNEEEMKKEDDITPKRSSKRSGSETIAYLRERAEQDHVNKLEELEIKRKDQQL